MLFNSYEFIFVYLPIVLMVYFLLGRLGKNYLCGSWLVLASIIFYGHWDFRYVPLLLSSIVVNFICGRFIEKYEFKKIILIVGIIFNVSLLGYYKYTAFFIDSINTAFGFSYDIPNIILPLGISFFTFTQTAYLVDAYRGETKGYSFWQYALFVTIFPHLIAGPIIHHANMISQFVDKKNILPNWDNISMGLSLFIMALAKKIIIADKIAKWAEEAFSHAESLNFIEAWSGALAYTLQLYFDFSAYSEMAIGIGLMFNIILPLNFDSPYKATSIIDFWRRWHMTLGSWVRNYLYIPMGGNRNGKLIQMRNLFISMVIIGIWHGAGWNFVVWGVLHGLYLVINHIWRGLDYCIPKAVSWLMTFTSVMIAWVLFRANTLTEGLYILKTMVDLDKLYVPRSDFYFNHSELFNSLGLQVAQYESLDQLSDCWGIIVGLLLVIVLLPNPYRIIERTFRTNIVWCACIFILFIVAIYRMNTYTEFLYFQF